MNIEQECDCNGTAHYMAVMSWVKTIKLTSARANGHAVQRRLPEPEPEAAATALGKAQSIAAVDRPHTLRAWSMLYLHRIMAI